MHELPITVISPERLSLVQIFRDLVRYRDLVSLLVWREISVRYKQTAVGVLWVALQPMLSALIFAVVFGFFVSLPSEGLPYLVFAYSGTLLWGLFAQGIDRASGSIVADELLIKRVYFPRWIIPLASVCSSLIDFAVCSVLLVVILLVYRLPPTLHLIWFLPTVLLVVAVAAAVGLGTAALNAKYRDFRLLVVFSLQIMQFLSPIFYSFELIRSKLRLLMYLNPMAGPIELFRLSVTGTSHFSPNGFAISFAVDLLLILAGVRIFYSLEDDLVDTI